jgi:hypothetical protein
MNNSHIWGFVAVIAVISVAVALFQKPTPTGAPNNNGYQQAATQNAVPQVSLSLTPTSSMASIGQTVTLDVMLDTKGLAVDGLDIFSLNYDPALVEVVDADSTKAGVQITGSPVMQVVSNKAEKGKITYSMVVPGGQTYTGQSKVASIQFKALKAGSANLSFDFTPGATSDTNVASSKDDVLQVAGSALIVVK